MAHNQCSSIGPSLVEIRKEIAEEESAESASEGYIPLHDVTPSGFISEGLDIEEIQYVIQPMPLRLVC